MRMDKNVFIFPVLFVVAMVASTIPNFSPLFMTAGAAASMLVALVYGLIITDKPGAAADAGCEVSTKRNRYNVACIMAVVCAAMAGNFYALASIPGGAAIVEYVMVGMLIAFSGLSGLLFGFGYSGIVKMRNTKPA